MAYNRPSRGFRPPRNSSFRPPRPHSNSHHSYSSSRYGNRRNSGSDIGSALGGAIALGITALAAGSAIKKARESNPSLQTKPQRKTISSTTQLYLPRVMCDFPNFHNPHAESDVKSVIKEYIYSIHSGKTSLECEGINREVFDRIIPKQEGNVTDIVFHQMEISNYQKSNNYATIFYQLSFGYLLNNAPVEVLYEVHYTLQSPCANIDMPLKCSNCNAPIEIGNMVTHCKYCDAQIFRNTISAWTVSDIQEILK